MGRQIKRAVIFCWSESDRCPLEVSSEDYIMCADSGYKYAERLGIKPNVLLGDFDSYAAKGCEALDIIVLPTEKDDTDAMYAAKLAVSEGFDEIILAGGLGGREDHTRGAVSVLKYIRNNCKGYICDGYTTVHILKSGESLTVSYDGNIQYISIFPCGTHASGVTLKGLKYELDNYTLHDDFPIGVSNEQTFGNDSIIICGDGDIEVYIIYR